MKHSALVILSFVALAWAADSNRPAPQSQGSADRMVLPKEPLRKLSSVTWDLDTHKLVWTVQKGDRVNGKFVSSSEEQFEISPDQAMMELGAEKRLFDDQEAVQLRRLLDTLSVYCAESVAWWEQGEGTPVDDKAPREKTDKPTQPSKPESKPVKVNWRAEAKEF
jgi:hypothetical protein